MYLRYKNSVSSIQNLEVKKMTEKEKQIIQTITDVLPKLSPEDKAFLLGFGEGLAASVDKPAK